MTFFVARRRPAKNKGRRRRMRRPIALAAALTLLLSGLSIGAISQATPVSAEPGNPGVPSEPIVLYEEDFENGSGVTELEDYASQAGVGYTASANWLNWVRCNGFILSAQDSMPSGYCDGRAGEWSAVQLKTQALGLLTDPPTPDTNRALSTNTSNRPMTANEIMFETIEQVPLDAANRFITFSVASAATACNWAHPQLRFYLRMDDGTTVPVSETAINPCTDPGRQEFNAAFYGQFVSDGAFLFESGSVGIVLRNESGAVNGNDGAIDNIRIVDVSPQIDKTFSPASVPVGGISTLTLTITNTSELGEKNGWQFTDNLPDGLVVADTANTGGTCDADVTALGGSSTIDVRDGVLEYGEASCTITVDVTSATPVGAASSPQEYQNCAANISDVIGLNMPNCAAVEFYSETGLEIDKTSDAIADARPGDTVTYTVTATNTGTADFTEDNPAVLFDDLSGVLDDAVFNDDAQADQPGEVSYESPLLSWTGPLEVGESVELTYSVTLQGGGDGAVRNVAWQPSDPENPEPPACAPPEDGVDPATGEPCAANEFFLPKLTIDKTADRTEISSAGEQVEYTITVTNPGPGDYSAEAPATFSDNLTDVLDTATFNDDAAATVGEVTYNEPTLSWEGPLAAGESVSVTYTVTYTARGDFVLDNVACVPESEVEAGAELCSDVQLPGAALQQWKTVEVSDEPVAAGTVLTYTLFFENSGEAAATVDAVDDLAHVTDDAEVTAEPSSDALTVTRDGDRISITGEVQPGETATVTYQMTVRPDGERGDDIAANFLMANDPEDPPTVPEEPVCQPQDGERPDCTVTPIGMLLTSKQVSADADPVETGSVLTYTLTFDNQGQGPIDVDHTDVLTDVLDDADLTTAPGASDDALTVSDVEDGQFTVTGELAAGQTVTVTYRVTVKDEADRGNNTADNFLLPTGEEPEGPCEADDPNCTMTPLPLIGVDKTADPESGSAVQEGDEVTYTLTFTNTGEAAGTVDYSDNLAGVLDDAELTGAPEVSDEALLATDGLDGIIRVTGALQPEQVVTVTYTVTVAHDGERGDNVLGNVVARTDIEDPDCEDAGASCTEHPAGELDQWKNVDPAPGTTVQQGAVLTYTLYFENTGEANRDFASEDVLTEVLDDADVTAQPVASTDELTVGDIEDGRFQISGTLAPGQQETVTYQVTVKPDGERGDDRLGNFLVGAGEAPPEECVPVDDERTDCTVNHVNDVVVTKGSDPESGTEVHTGDSVTYTLTFTNTSANVDAAPAEIDYTDHMADVLDDADLTAGPTVSNDGLVATVAGETIVITGEVPSGETSTVSYTVSVRDYADRGNGHLGNVVAVTGEEPVCAPDSPLCTEHDIPAEPEAPTPDADLPRTGGELSTGALLLAMALLIAGGAAVAAASVRNRRADTGRR